MEVSRKWECGVEGKTGVWRKRVCGCEKKTGTWGGGEDGRKRVERAGSKDLCGNERKTDVWWRWENKQVLVRVMVLGEQNLLLMEGGINYQRIFFFSLSKILVITATCEGTSVKVSQNLPTGVIGPAWRRNKACLEV